jgi:hypothetical protein
VYSKGDLVVNAKLTIKNVLFCPDVTMNLVSASQLCDQGMTLECNQHSIFVKKNKEVILKAYRQQDLYVYHIKSNNVLATTNSSKRTELFHRRMGHLNFKSLRLLSHLSDGMVLDQNPSELCEICQQAKAKRPSFALSRSLASHVGELTHADICSVRTPTIIGKETMFLVLIDDATPLYY